MPQFEAGMRLKLSEGDADYPAMVLANYMFGGSITARMPNRIRNREGLQLRRILALRPLPRKAMPALFLRHGELQSGQHAESGSQFRR
jgi:hypothetical protein